MKKRGIWVKVKPADGLYHLRFDVSLFTYESRADVTPFLLLLYRESACGIITLT